MYIKPLKNHEKTYKNKKKGKCAKFTDDIKYSSVNEHNIYILIFSI